MQTFIQFGAWQEGPEILLSIFTKLPSDTDILHCHIPVLGTTLDQQG